MPDDPAMAPDAAAQAAPGAEMPLEAPQDGPPEQQDAGAAQQASPEEQGQYDQFVGRAMELIYNQKMFPQVVEMLRGGHNDGQDPKEAGASSGSAQGLAHATAMIITRVYKAATDAGAELSPDVIFHGGTEIFGQLAEISDKAGISDYANDRDQLEAAYFLAVDTAMQQLRKAGVVDEASAKDALQQLQGMDAKGELEQVFRDLDAKDQSQGGAEPEPANDNEVPPQGGMAPQEMG